MGRESGPQNLKSQEPRYTSDLSLPARTSAPSASAVCLSCGRTRLVLLVVLSAVLRSIFAAFQNLPLPHHGRKRAVFVFAAFLLLSSGNARAQGSKTTDEGICDRTEQVRTAILAQNISTDTCSAVTHADLAALTGTLNLTVAGIASLRSGDFSGLVTLEGLYLTPELCTDSLCECGCVRSGLAVVVRW